MNKLTALIMLSAYLSVVPLQASAATERECLAAAAFAGSLVDLRKDMTEKAALREFVGNSTGRAARHMTTLIRLVYLLEMDAQNTKLMIYTKCMAGAFDE